MTAPITDYTSYDEIRAALGVSKKEIVDATLGLSIYANFLEMEFEEVDSTVPALYQATAGLPSPTAAEVRFLSACRLFAVYSVAKHLTGSLPLFAPRQIGDGKASVQRFDSPYKDTVAAVNQMYDKAKNRLASALGDIGTSVTSAIPLTFVSVVTPISDPVTGT